MLCRPIRDEYSNFAGATRHVSYKITTLIWLFMKTPLVKKCLRNIWMVPIVGTPVRYSVGDIVRSTPKTVSTLAHGARSRNGTVFPTCLGGHGVRTFCTPASGAALWWWISVKVQVNNYEIVVNFFHIGHNLTWYSAIVHKFTRIYPVCSTYELTKQLM